MKTIDRREPLVNRSFARAARDIGPVKVRVSIDTIELFFQRAPAGLRTRIEAALGRRIEIKPCLDATGYRQGVRAIINRPNRRVLTVASELKKENRSARVFRVDVAADCETANDQSEEALASILDRNLVLKWRPATSTKHSVLSTVYWANGCRSRNLAMYYKRARTIRLELRFLNSRSVRRAKLANPAALAHLDPRKLLAHNLKLVALTERHISNMKRRAVSKDRKRHIQKRAEASRSGDSELFHDRYRSGIAGRVDYILRHLDMQEGLSWCRALRSAIDSFSILDFLNIPDVLTFPDDAERSSTANEPRAVTRNKSIRPYPFPKFSLNIKERSRPFR